MIRVQLDKSRKIQFTNRAIMNFEDAADIGIIEFVNLVQESAEKGSFPRMKIICYLVWAGLNDDDVSFDDVVGMVGINNLGTVLPPVMEALSLAMGSKLVDEKKTSRRVKK